MASYGETVNVIVRVLLLSLDSEMRFGSSTTTTSVCVPVVAFQVVVADSVRVAPTPSDDVLLVAEPTQLPSTWNEIPRRVEANVDRLLELFSRNSISATFFVLGWIAERHPEMIRRIATGGHELASHGYDHTRRDRSGCAAKGRRPRGR